MELKKRTIYRANTSISFSTPFLLEHLLHSGTEEEKESDKDSYLLVAVVLLLHVRSCQFDMSSSGREKCRMCQWA